MSVARQAVVVVPCYNEELRIQEDAFHCIARSGDVRLLFVDDGSMDETASLLGGMASQSASMDVMRLPSNVGKAEAVRQGMLRAAAERASIIGYYDADMATPPGELLRLLAAMQANGRLQVVMGARIAKLGSSIDRSVLRHYLGRLYATLASSALGVQVYDTQCGAKLFRSSPALEAAISKPFRSSWGFDVELINRLLRGDGAVSGVPEAAFLELALDSWEAKSGSKLKFASATAAVFDLLAICVDRVLRDHLEDLRQRRPPNVISLEKNSKCYQTKSETGCICNASRITSSDMR